MPLFSCENICNFLYKLKKKLMFSKFLSIRSLFKATLIFCRTMGALLLLIHQCMTRFSPPLSFSPFKTFYCVYLKQFIDIFIFRFLSSEWKKNVGFMLPAMLDHICCYLSKIRRLATRIRISQGCLETL